MSGLSRRELEHKKLLDQIENETPEGSGATTSAATSYANNVGVLRNRDRANQEEFAQQTVNKPMSEMTPQERKAYLDESTRQETARMEKISKEARQKRANILAEQERVRLAHELENQRRVEARQAVVAQTIATDIKASIKAIMLPNLDILDECRILVERQRKSHIPEYWASAVKQIRAQKKV